MQGAAAVLDSHVLRHQLDKQHPDEARARGADCVLLAAEHHRQQAKDTHEFLGQPLDARARGR